MLTMGVGCCCGNCPSDKRYHRCASWCCDQKEQDSSNQGKMPCCVIGNGISGSGSGGPLGGWRPLRSGVGSGGQTAVDPLSGGTQQSSFFGNIFSQVGCTGEYGDAYPRNVGLWFHGDPYYFSSCSATCYSWSVNACESGDMILDPPCDSVQGGGGDPRFASVGYDYFSTDGLNRLSFDIIAVRTANLPPVGCDWGPDNPSGTWFGGQPSPECYNLGGYWVGSDYEKHNTTIDVGLQLIIFAYTSGTHLGSGFSGSRTAIDPTDDTQGFRDRRYSAIYRAYLSEPGTGRDCNSLLDQTFCADRVPNTELKCVADCCEFPRTGWHAVDPTDDTRSSGGDCLEQQVLERTEVPFIGYSQCLPDQIPISFPADKGTSGGCQDIRIRNIKQGNYACGWCEKTEEPEPPRDPRCDPYSIIEESRFRKIVLSGVKNFPEGTPPPSGESMCTKCEDANGTYILEGDCLGYRYGSIQGTNAFLSANIDSEWIADPSEHPRVTCSCNPTDGKGSSYLIDGMSLGMIPWADSHQAGLEIWDSSRRVAEWQSKERQGTVNCKDGPTFTRDEFGLPERNEIGRCDFSNAKVSLGTVPEHKTTNGACIDIYDLLRDPSNPWLECRRDRTCYSCSEGCFPLVGDNYLGDCTATLKVSGVDNDGKAMTEPSRFIGEWSLTGGGCGWRGERMQPSGIVDYLSIRPWNYKNFLEERCELNVGVSYVDSDYTGNLEFSFSNPTRIGWDRMAHWGFHQYWYSEASIDGMAVSEYEPCSLCKYSCMSGGSMLLKYWFMEWPRVPVPVGEFDPWYDLSDEEKLRTGTVLSRYSYLFELSEANCPDGGVFQ